MELLQGLGAVLLSLGLIHVLFGAPRQEGK